MVKKLKREKCSTCAHRERGRCLKFFYKMEEECTWKDHQHWEEKESYNMTKRIENKDW